ncbi:MAG: putative 2-dehydropantoate 2-reductase [Leptolyngbyaceae cyanobacterium RM2_2_4]|nr:putative 2-dehydropantoate 2-reductase [Leptolyngbyaceae cyanobacterium SM1_4_3]NJO50931.1 putative 2-dehydropantoate 2-reductase [Leptolyngbyaceae cyanobacterium RM2_2_4]
MVLLNNSQSDRSYAILGTGALGGFYGARLQQAGAEVHFLLRSDYQHVRQHGLTIDSVQGNFKLPQVHAYASVEQMPPCDVIVVALKTTQNYLLPQLLPPLVSETSTVLVLQNGLGVEAEAAQIVGAEKVIGGLCFLCSNKIAPGHIHHLDYGAIALGHYSDDNQPCGITRQMSEIADDFRRANVSIDLKDDLFLARWQKLVWNIPFNGLSVVLNATTEEMMTNPAVQKLAEQIMREVQMAAEAYGRSLPDSYIQKMLDHTAKMKPYRTSMKIDYDERRPLEIEAIFGKPLNLAQQAGAQIPRIEMLYQQLQFLDKQNRSV